jgi:pyruvate kinase
MIQALFEAGADVFRMNFSHGDHADHKARFDAIRAVEKEVERPIGILADMQGPKLRVGTFADGPVVLTAGQTFRLDMDKTPGDLNRVSLPHPEIFRAVEAGTDLLIADGTIRLRIDTLTDSSADCTVLAGGEISNRKGVNVPNAVLDIAALTDKDRKDMQYALELGVDWVALSFVQRPADVAEARKLIAGRAALMAKIEKPAAVETLEEIVEISDGIMVARGDLGVELPVEDVPGLQKTIIGKAREAGKPVVVATQMLESMISAAVPTRAEVSDVATAVFDGADAVMLSAESAAGDYPVESVAMMDGIARKIEKDPRYRTIINALHPSPEATAADAITAAAAQVAETIGAAAVVTYSTTGSTTLKAAREKPVVPILGLTPNENTARRLAIAWGVHSVHTHDPANFADMVERACRLAFKDGFARAGQRIVVTAGVPLGTPGATNILRIAWVGDQRDAL